MLPILAFFAAGLIFGSFISAYSFRWPRNIPIGKGRSFCDNCKTGISWYDNFPLFSYIILKGKCRNCKTKISLRYPFIELLTASVFVSVYLSFSACISGVGGYSTAENLICKWNDYLGSWVLPYFLLISALLVVVFIIDLENKLIPDEAVFFIFSISFIALLLSSSRLFYVILFAAFSASTFFLLLNLITNGRGMGLGDAKLILALSLAFFDWKMLLFFIFGSFIIGAAIGIFLITAGKAKFGKQIPFGPFIIASFFITMFWGDLLIKILFPYLL
jgi:prepilin signal peptidase PulO-like enzyme (type II secretory pathway)